MREKIVLSFLYMVLAMAAFTMGGCASAEWAAMAEKTTDLAWPAPPNQAKVSYLGEIKGFQQTGQSLATLLFGRDTGGKLMTPVAIALGSDGRMAIADLQKEGVHLFLPNTRQYRFIDRFRDERLQSPVSVVFDDANRLFVSESALKKVFLYDEQGEAAGVIDSARTQGESKVGRTPFVRPTGLAFQHGRLYITDTMSHVIHVFGRDLEPLYSFGKRGGGDGQFNMPTHLTIDKDDRIVLNDSMNFRVQFLDLEGHFFEKFGHHGDGSGDFAMSKGIGVDGWGVIYVVDTLFDAVQLFDRKGTFLLTVGSRGTEPGKFWLPSGLFIDENNKMFICDTYNQRIQIFQLQNNQPNQAKSN